MERLRELIALVGPSDISVLIQGETGVGKELVAEQIHRLSPRAGGPFLALNCAEFSESLLDSELFGHERGAFTGAQKEKPGLLEAADGGTLLLDEIGEMQLSVQAKLLRFLEKREVRRIAAVKARKVDLRVLSATNRDLEASIANGAFRRDLYFRLRGVSLFVPPLRERVDEIEQIAGELLREKGCPAKLSPEAADALQRHDWPGNVRELRNTLELAALLCGGKGPITPEHLQFGARAGSPPPSDADDERQRILDALNANAWNQTRAARDLGISRRTLVSLLEKYRLPRPHGP